MSFGDANGGVSFYNDEPVGVYNDGVYVARLSVSTPDLLDTKSIQILRVPKGKLYGRSQTAGGVLFGPLSQIVSRRLALGYLDQKGFGRNSFNGLTPSDVTSLTGRTAINHLHKSHP